MSFGLVKRIPRILCWVGCFWSKFRYPSETRFDTLVAMSYFRHQIFQVKNRFSARIAQGNKSREVLFLDRSQKWQWHCLANLCVAFGPLFSEKGGFHVSTLFTHLPPTFPRKNWLCATRLRQPVL